MTAPPTEDDTERVERVAVPYAKHEREMLAALAQRDAAYAAADALAEKVAAGRWIGEHTSENNPWQNALDLSPDLDRARAEGREQGLREAEQAVRELLVDSAIDASGVRYVLRADHAIARLSSGTPTDEETRP